MSSVIGCLSTGIFMPVGGSSTFGAVMSTPGIGPATVGLSGLELLDASQALAMIAASARPAAYTDLLFIGTHTGARVGYRIEKSGGLEIQGWEPGLASPGRVAGGR